MKEHRILANGLTQFVRDSGDGAAPAAILLHGFPDSNALWAKVTPFLCAQGFRIIAPDMRGFGETEMAAEVAGYDIETGAAKDVLGILDRLGVDQAHVVGHDFGAAVAWSLAAQYKERFLSLTALSVGHPRAFLKAGAEQKLRSLYILFHQLRGVCEFAYRAGDWRLLRRHWAKHGDIDEAIRLLSRPGRLTAGLNWYRANISLARMVNPPPIGALGIESVRVPTLGVWSTCDPYLTEAQMAASAQFVDAPWRYERLDCGHWIPYDEPARLAGLLAGHWRASGVGLAAGAGPLSAVAPQ